MYYWKKKHVHTKSSSSNFGNVVFGCKLNNFQTLRFGKHFVNMVNTTLNTGTFRFARTCTFFIFSSAQEKPLVTVELHTIQVLGRLYKQIWHRRSINSNDLFIQKLFVYFFDLVSNIFLTECWLYEYQINFYFIRNIFLDRRFCN